MGGDFFTHFMISDSATGAAPDKIIFTERRWSSVTFGLEPRYRTRGGATYKTVLLKKKKKNDL